MNEKDHYIFTRLLEIDSQIQWRVFSGKDSQLAGMLLRHLIQSNEYQVPSTDWGNLLSLELMSNELTYESFRNVMDSIYSKQKNSRYQNRIRQLRPSDIRLK